MFFPQILVWYTPLTLERYLLYTLEFSINIFNLEVTISFLKKPFCSLDCYMTFEERISKLYYKSRSETIQKKPSLLFVFSYEHTTGYLMNNIAFTSHDNFVNYQLWCGGIVDNNIN